MLHVCATYAGPTRTGLHRYGSHCGLVFDLKEPAPLESLINLPVPEQGDRRCTMCMPSALKGDDPEDVAANLDPTLGGLEDANGLGEIQCDDDLGALEEEEPG
jgi:hypothetical protein